jgi:hypothetical protein
VTIANDIDIGVPLGAQTATRLATGGGADVRAGYRFRIPYQPIAITPELAAGWAELSTRIFRFHPGIRLSVGQIVTAYAYGHVGCGWARLGGAAGQGMSLPGVVASGVALDGGGGLDVEIVPRLTVGAHLGLNLLAIGATNASMLSAPLRWVSTGLSASFRF